MHSTCMDKYIVRCVQMFSHTLLLNVGIWLNLIIYVGKIRKKTHVEFTVLWHKQAVARSEPKLTCLQYVDVKFFKSFKDNSSRFFTWSIFLIFIAKLARSKSVRNIDVLKNSVIHYFKSFMFFKQNSTCLFWHHSKEMFANFYHP